MGISIRIQQYSIKETDTTGWALQDPYSVVSETIPHYAMKRKSFVYSGHLYQIRYIVFGKLMISVGSYHIQSFRICFNLNDITKTNTC